MIRDAIFSEDGTRRYRLTRSFELPLGQKSRGNLGWAMLNPSKAGKVDDDPTIRKCVGFAKRWGFSEITVVNLIPIVCTDPYNLPPWNGLFMDNEPYVQVALAQCDLFIVAWGAVPQNLARTVAWAEHVYRFRRMAEHNILHCIGRTKNGSPFHPSRIGYVDAPERWSFTGGY
jgi:hypothetical protein